MTTKEKYEEILNKQFKKSIFSGYDTLDVDTYFDEIIEYLKDTEKRTADAEAIAAQYKKANEALTKEVEKLKQDLAQSETIINEYKANGYANINNDQGSK